MTHRWLLSFCITLKTPDGHACYPCACDRLCVHPPTRPYDKHTNYLYCIITHVRLSLSISCTCFLVHSYPRSLNHTPFHTYNFAFSLSYVHSIKYLCNLLSIPSSNSGNKDMFNQSWRIYLT